MEERAHLSIGEVLSLLRDEFPDITISKIRFLESQGLVDPERTPSGYRKFYDDDVERLRWILRQQRELFLPLKVIKGRLPAAAADPTGGDDAALLGEPQPGRPSPVGPSRQPIAADRPSVHGGVEGRHDTGVVHTGARVASASGGPPAEAASAAPGSRAGTTGRAARSDGGPGPSAGGHVMSTMGSGPHAAGSAVGAAGSAPGPSGSDPAAGTPPSAGATAPSAGATAPSAGATPPSGGAAPIRPGTAPPGAARAAAATGADPAPGSVGGAGRPTSAAGPPAGTPLPPPAPQQSAAAATGTGRGGPPGPAAGPPAGPPSDPLAGPAPSDPPVASGPAAGPPDDPRTPGTPDDPTGAGTTGDPAGPATAAPDLTDTLAEVNLTAAELAVSCGLSVALVRELERFGLVSGRDVGGTTYYDAEAQRVTQLAAAFAAHGVEARHLRMYKNAADRESGLFEQVVMPLIKQRNPNARQQAAGTLEELASLGRDLREILLRRALRDAF